jgi:N-acetylglucosaminyl-diphospho-decaprenol L-rhamnosyltransferase
VRPLVSVCVVNWNCRALLRRCLHSLTARRQGVRLEVIVVDNGSTDGAAEMTERVFPGVQLIRNARNEPFARANNQAARIARGRYLFFLNNDTELAPGTLRRLVEYAREHPEAGLIGPCLRHPSGRAQVSCRRRPSVAALLHRTWLLRWTGLFRAAYRRYRCRQEEGPGVRPVEVMMGAALLLPRRVFRECGPWDEDYTFGGEDIDLCTRVARRHAVLYHPDIAVVHHGRASSRQHAGYAHVHTVAGITRFLRKSGTPAWALFAYKTALTLDAPLQWLGHALQYICRRLRGDAIGARKSRQMLTAAGHFLTRGLAALWRA